MKTIWRFPLNLAEQMPVRMPLGTRILHAALNADGVPCLWAEVESEAPTHVRQMSSFGTGGWLPPDRGPHLATFLTDVDGDEYVFHLYDEDPLDPLTGALTVDRFHQELHGLPRASGGAVLALLDVDHLGEVERKLGAEPAEQALGEIGRRLRRGLAVLPGAVLGRIAGDEFALLLPGTDTVEAAPLIEDLLVEIARPQQLGGRQMIVTASAGLARLVPGAGTETPWSAADAALARAKAQGRDRLVVSQVDPLA